MEEEWSKLKLSTACKLLGLLARVPRDSGGLSLSLVERDTTCL